MASARMPARLIAAASKSVRSRPLPVAHFSVLSQSSNLIQPLLSADISKSLRLYSTSALRKQSGGSTAASDSSAGAKPTSEQAANEQKPEQSEEQFTEDVYYEDEPLAARISRCASLGAGAFLF